MASDLDERLRVALRPLSDTARGWIEDQLSGTSYYEQNIKVLETDVEQTIEAIKQAFKDAAGLED